MTQPDRWDEIANQLAFDAVSYERGHYDDSPGSCEVDRAAIATALRNAYAEGESTGMEKAAKIVESVAAIIDYPSVYMGGPSRKAKRDAKEIADAIRAAKETKE